MTRAEESISRRLFDLCLDTQGRLPKTAYFGAVVRAGVWIELAEKAIYSGSSSEPNGALLEHAARLAEAPTLEEGGQWIDCEQYGLELMARVLINSGDLLQSSAGGLFRQARFETTHKRRRNKDLKLILPDETQSANTTVVAILGSTGQLLGERRNSGFGSEPSLIDETSWEVLEDLKPAVKFADEYLRWRKRRNNVETSIWT